MYRTNYDFDHMMFFIYDDNGFPYITTLDPSHHGYILTTQDHEYRFPILDTKRLISTIASYMTASWSPQKSINIFADEKIRYWKRKKTERIVSALFAKFKNSDRHFEVLRFLYNQGIIEKQLKVYGRLYHFPEILYDILIYELDGFFEERYKTYILPYLRFSEDGPYIDKEWFSLLFPDRGSIINHPNYNYLSLEAIEESTWKFYMVEYNKGLVDYLRRMPGNIPYKYLFLLKYFTVNIDINTSRFKFIVLLNLMYLSLYKFYLLTGQVQKIIDSFIQYDDDYLMRLADKKGKIDNKYCGEVANGFIRKYLVDNNLSMYLT